MLLEIQIQIQIDNQVPWKNEVERWLGSLDSRKICFLILMNISDLH